MASIHYSIPIEGATALYDEEVASRCIETVRRAPISCALLPVRALLLVRGALLLIRGALLPVHHALSPVRGVCLSLALVACGSETSDTSGAAAASGAGGSAASAAGASGGPAAELPYQPCPAESAVGEFTIELGDGFTSVDGRVFDAVTPSLVPEELASEGDCRLLTLPNLLCEPACPPTTQTCGEGNQCLPLPVAQSVGSVSVSGLARPVEMSANETTGSYRPGPPALPHPGFSAGADLRLAASGGAYAPFELRGWGITPFQLGADPVNVSAGQPVALAWAPPADAGPARIRAVLNINNHGSSNTAIECAFADTGSASIPAALIDRLIDLGASGFPTLTLTRRTATSTNLTPGCVQLVVTTDQLYSLDVSLDGLVSCDTDAMCPQGQTCKPLERFCE